MTMTTPTFDLLTITNEIHTGSAFAVRHSTGESCFVPAAIMHRTGLQIGDTAEGLLIDNPNRDVAQRTPYLVRFIKMESLPRPAPVYAPAPPVPAPKPVFSAEEVETFVRKHMNAGGVWSVGRLFEEYMNDPDASRDDNPQAYNAISSTLRKMFEHDECAKWSMWTKASQSKPGKEWFSCYPERADVDEWAET